MAHARHATAVALSLMLAITPSECVPRMVVPTDGQVFRASVVFAPGKYVLPHGISIGNEGVTINLNGATLVGPLGESSGKGRSPHAQHTAEPAAAAAAAQASAAAAVTSRAANPRHKASYHDAGLSPQRQAHAAKLAADSYAKRARTLATPNTYVDEKLLQATTSVGITADGFDNVAITNGTVTGYYYGVRLVNTMLATITHCDLSHNWQDPNATVAPPALPPWLDINVEPTAFGTDFVNLGGGLWLENATDCSVMNNVMQHQANGIDAFRVTRSQLSYNDASFNVGWGIHLWKSSENTIHRNTADNCTRGPQHYTCDTAGLLMNCECSYNTVTNNSFTFGGDGIFMSGFPRQQRDECCPSNNNIVEDNNCAMSPNNAIESTFAVGNVFRRNVLDGSNYGLWLGYSHTGNVVADNLCRGCVTAGIAIEHGQHNSIVGNRFGGSTQGNGVALFTDLQIHFPASQFGCLQLPDAAHSNHYNVSANLLMLNAVSGVSLLNTTDSTVYNNWVAPSATVSGSVTAIQDGTLTTGNAFNVSKQPAPHGSGGNVIGGPFLGGSYWSDYTGKDTNGDGIGDTELPYVGSTKVGGGLTPGDWLPLVKVPGQVLRST